MAARCWATRSSGRRTVLAPAARPGTFRIARTTRRVRAAEVNTGVRGKLSAVTADAARTATALRDARLPRKSSPVAAGLGWILPRAAALMERAGRSFLDASEFIYNRVFVVDPQCIHVHQPAADHSGCDFGILAWQDIALQDAGVSAEHLSVSHKRELLRVGDLSLKRRLIENEDGHRPVADGTCSDV